MAGSAANRGTITSAKAAPKMFKIVGTKGIVDRVPGRRGSTLIARNHPAVPEIACHSETYGQPWLSMEGLRVGRHFPQERAVDGVVGLLEVDGSHAQWNIARL